MLKIEKSNDGLITGVCVNSIAKTKMSIPQCDLSIIDIGILSVEDCENMFRRIYWGQKNNHIIFAIVRGTKKKKGETLAKALLATEYGWELEEIVTNIYERPMRNSKESLSERGEVMLLFTKKGKKIDAQKTSWFFPEIGNATNVWDLSPHPSEGVTSCISRNFSWESGILMTQLASPLVCRKILNVGKLDINFCKFIKYFNLQVYVISNQKEHSINVIKKYNTYINERKGSIGNG